MRDGNEKSEKRKDKESWEGMKERRKERRKKKKNNAGRGKKC